MKKLFFSLFAMTFLFAGAAFAQEQPADPATEEPAIEEAPLQEDPSVIQEEPVQEEPVQEEPADNATASADAQEVQFDELPDAVKSSFENSDYAMWQVQTVYEMAPAQGTESAMYELTVTDGTTEETVTFNEDGEQQ